MATKAELEAELADLKKMFAETTGASPRIPENPASDEEESAAGQDMSEVMASLKASDLEDMAKQIMKELESLPEKKPLLTALGAFVLGYLIGRSR